MQDRGGTAFPVLEREGACPPYLSDSLLGPEVCARKRAVAKRARGLGQAQLSGKRERPLGGRDRLLVRAGEVPSRGQLDVGSHELRTGRLRLEKGERVREGLLPRRGSP